MIKGWLAGWLVWVDYNKQVKIVNDSWVVVCYFSLVCFFSDRYFSVK